MGLGTGIADGPYRQLWRTLTHFVIVILPIDFALLLLLLLLLYCQSHLYWSWRSSRYHAKASSTLPILAVTGDIQSPETATICRRFRRLTKVGDNLSPWTVAIVAVFGHYIVASVFWIYVLNEGSKDQHRLFSYRVNFSFSLLINFRATLHTLNTLYCTANRWWRSKASLGLHRCEIRLPTGVEIYWIQVVVLGDFI